MIVVNGKIVKCTDQELYKYWLTRWSDLYDYDDYKKRVIANGTEVKSNDSNRIN